MKNPSTEMSKMMKIMEAYMGKQDGSDIEYEPSKNGDKITAKVSGHLSASLTKMAKNIDHISKLQEEIDLLSKETKADAREVMSDLFTAEDEVRTRVVETRSFSITLTKTPKPTETVKYTKVLEEFTEHLTPELIQILEDIKAKHTTVTQKAASLSYKANESIITNPLIKIQKYLQKFLPFVDKWCSSYDKKLDSLKLSLETV